MRNPSYENDFDLHENEIAYRTHFHMKGLALRLVLKPRHKRTRKWPIQSTPLLRYDTPRIQPPLIRSRYHVRNAKRGDVSHVVVGANERRLYSQTGATTSEKNINRA